MNSKKISDHIVSWLTDQLVLSRQKGFVVGVSGGIDSAVVSTLCAITGKPVIVLNMPIYQVKEQFNRSDEHIKWLGKNFNNITPFTIDLTQSFQSLCDELPESAKTDLALVNSRSRLRMLTLYSFANSNNSLVCGTGNKVEDFGIGFFTKYGDGGVDISPIADLVKSEVYELGKYLGVVDSILNAAPTDGLWEVDRTDEDQIGASYDELEWAMNYMEGKDCYQMNVENETNLTSREKEVLRIYLQRHISSKHKLIMPPVCSLKGIK